MRDYSMMTVGIDLGDKYSDVCVLDREGEVVERTRLRTTVRGLQQFFQRPMMRVVLEVGVHSRWVSEQLLSLGHEVHVANPRQLGLIYGDRRKDDATDAEKLARIGRVDVRLLRPIRHRRREAQLDLVQVRARDTLVRSRTALINSVIGQLKAFGHRVARCSSSVFDRRVRDCIPDELRAQFEPMLASIAAMTLGISQYDRSIAATAQTRYPEAQQLTRVHGVGSLTALAFVLSIDDASRFRKSREVAPYLGLSPRRDQTGQIDRQRGISKAGDPYLRRLLVQCAHRTLGVFGEDSDLRRWGLKLAGRGGKNGKKRAVIAVASKLAVLLHRLWISGEAYVPIGYEATPKRNAA